MRRLLPLLALGVFSLAACHPLACFFPPSLPKDPPYELVSTNEKFPAKKVEIRVDALGVPHIFGKSDDDIAYGIGVMHGRDRAFQILVYKHAAQGRLTELLGADYLEADRQQRMLTWRLDDQLEHLDKTDKKLLDAYVAGVNEGAAWAGKSAEMFLLGVEFGKLTVRDVLSIVRLQQWGQAVGFDEEMARYRMVKQLGSAKDPRAIELLRDAPSGGVPIVRPEEHDGTLPDAATARAPLAELAEPRVNPNASRDDVRKIPPDNWKTDLVNDLFRKLREDKGASNEWAVSGEHTKSGAAMMCNDPHLQHSGPGIFYMVHLEGPDYTIAGGTFPGIPGVLIGHGKDIAWGVTNAEIDTMDVAVLETVQSDDSLYLVDGTPLHFGTWEQCFTLGKEDDGERVCEDYETSIFGPVIPEGYGSYGGATPLVEKGEKLALLWTAAEFPEDNARMVTSFWRLAKSQTVIEATEALQDFSAPSMAVVMAFTDGTIAFRLSGIVPLRGDDQRVDFPRRGASRASGWVGRMPASQKPQSTNPAKGFIVAANQRVVDNDVLTQRTLGFEEAKPYRAMRITERLTKLLDDKKPSIEELCEIQQDTVSLEAKKLAPVIAKHCPAHVDGHDDARVKSFCKAIDDFDGDFKLDAVALPYARTAREFILSVLEAHVDSELALDMASTTSIVVALTDLAVAENKGDVKAAIFDDPRKSGREGLSPFVARAVKRALDQVVADAGGSEGDWTWGKNHQMSTRGLLYSAPVVGFLFDTWGHDESGISESPRAEGPDFNNKMRVRFGAGLRLFAEMKEKGAEVRMVNDSGQSGHFGHAHIADQNPLWSAGTPYKIAKTKKEIDAELEGSLDLLPKK